MKIRQKCILVIALSLTISAALNFAVMRLAVFPSFLKLEQESATTDMQRVLSAIDAQLSDIEHTIKDNANWSELYNYADNPNSSFIKINYNADVLRNINVQYMSVVNRDGATLFAGIFMDDAGAASSVGGFATVSSDTEAALRGISTAAIPAGLLMTPRGPLLLAASPILRGDGQGPAAGTLLMGRILGERLLQEIGDATRVTFRILPVGGNPLAESEAAAFNSLENGEAVVVNEASDGLLAAYALIRDLHGRPALLVHAMIPRHTSAAGMRALQIAIGGIIAAGLLVIAVMTMLLQLILVGPISRLTQHLLEIGSSGDLSRRLASPRRDEIGLLSEEFDRMLQKLKDAYGRLLDQSYSAGVAEMAAGVLHNIRNQLAPLSLRLDRVQHDLVEGADSKLGRALEELQSPTLDAARKEKILRFVKLTFENSKERHDHILRELHGVTEGFVRIEHFLRDLDRVSRRKDAVAEIDLISVVRQSVASLPKYPDIEIIVRIDPHIDRCPPVETDPFLLRHVLQNLLVNAVEAILAAGKSRGTIFIRAIATRHSARPEVDVQIEDEGIGIAADKLETIFARGYSTKKGDRRGMGLHWCANSMLALGGRIYAESPGVGGGATMHLVVPSLQSARKAA